MKESLFGNTLNAIGKCPDKAQAMDEAHAFLIAGLIAAHKPKEILELGAGSGYLSRVILEALNDNQQGTLTSVDNFFDWQGQIPEFLLATQEQYPQWNLVQNDEHHYLSNHASDSFDFIISDGDHVHGYQHAGDIFRLAKPGAILIFHDTHNELFRLLKRLPNRVRQLGFSHFHFTQKSIEGEQTDRGMLVVCKDRNKHMSMDIATRFFLRYRKLIPQSLVERLKR